MPITTYDYLTTIDGPSDEDLAAVEVPNLDDWDILEEE